jgi:holo-[acyl-carrier protein] synthase
MIVGIGVDIVEVARIAGALSRHGERFAKKVLSPVELSGFMGVTARAAWLAKRFAAKEAVAKALGTGMRAGVAFSQITLSRRSTGAPMIELTGMAAARAADLGAERVHISIADERLYAIAYVILETAAPDSVPD